MKMFMFTKLCRLCINDKDVASTLNNFDSDNIIMLDKLNRIAPRLLKVNNNLPNGICETCIAQLHQSYKFLQNCFRSQEILEKYLEQLKNGLYAEQSENYEIVINAIKLEQNNAINYMNDMNIELTNEEFHNTFANYEKETVIMEQENSVCGSESIHVNFEDDSKVEETDINHYLPNVKTEVIEECYADTIDIEIDKNVKKELECPSEDVIALLTDIKKEITEENVSENNINDSYFTEVDVEHEIKTEEHEIKGLKFCGFNSAECGLANNIKMKYNLITTPVQEEVVSESIEILNVSNKLEQLNKSVVDEIKSPELTNRTIEIIATGENSKTLTEITTPVKEKVVSESTEILNVSDKLEQSNNSLVDEIKSPGLTNRTIEITEADANSSLTSENSKTLTEISTSVQEEVVSESTEILNVSNQLEQRNNSVVNAVEVPEQINVTFETVVKDENSKLLCEVDAHTKEEIISEPEIKQNASSKLEQLTNSIDEITNENEEKFEILCNFDNEQIPMSADSNQNSDLCQSSAPKKLSTDEMGEVINERNSFEKQSDVPNGTSDEKLSIDNKESHDFKIQMYSQMMERLAIAEIDCEKYKDQANELKKELKKKTLELEQISNVNAKKRDEFKSLKAKEIAYLYEIKELKSQVNKLENIIKEAQKEENKLADDLSSKTQSELQISRVMEEYEKSISSLIAENEKMKKERDTAQMHLGNIELAFSDVHQKYERCKLIVQTYKDNEETFKHDIGMNLETIAIQEQKYDTLKSHATAQLEKSNLELTLMKKQQEAEVARLTAQLKRYEINNISLMESLQQKSKECEQLSAVCDEFIGNV